MDGTLPFRVGYSTSGFAHHRLEDALDVLARIGYRAVCITPDVVHLDPFAPGLAARTSALAAKLRSLDFTCVVECGARFVLDPMRKHRPTLLSRDGAPRRAEFLRSMIAVARDLGADCMSFWSGAKDDDMDDAEARDRLVSSVQALVVDAARARIDLAFEPEPGMFVATVADFRTLDSALGSPARFGLALDVGHVVASGEGDPADVIRAAKDRLTTVAIEDMRRGVHEHLPFGDGHLDLPAVVDALEAIGWRRLVCVELPRQSHDAVRTATRSAEILGALGAEFRPRGPA